MSERWNEGDRRTEADSTSAGMDAVVRAELRRSRQAVFGPGAQMSPQMAVFADRVALAVGGRESVVPGPDNRVRLPAPHEVVAAPRREQPGPPPVLGGPESVPLPDAPALVCDGSDRIVRVNPALLRLAGRESEGGIGLFGMPLPQLVVGPDADARLVRPDDALVRVRVRRWDVPGRELRAVVLVALGPAAAPAFEDRGEGRRWVGELEPMARVGIWTFELATSTLRRSLVLEELYGSLGVEPSTERAALETDQVARLCAALRVGDDRPDHHLELELPGGHRLGCHAEVECATDGTPIRLVGVVRDIGAQRAVERRLQRSGQRFADLVAVLPVGVVMVDPGGRIVDANPALCALLDVQAEQLRGRPAAAIAVDRSGERPVGALPEWLRLVRPGSRHGYPVESVPLRRADGTRAWCDLHVSVTTADDGGWFWLIVCSDLAERHRAAEQLHRAARTDALTGLPTRDDVLDLLDDLLTGPTRRVVAVVCVGVDDFRRINHSLGHDAGDEALAALAGRLRDELPAGCTPARLSGDQFVVVCADHRVAGSPADLAWAIADLLGGGALVRGRPVRLSVSVGVAAGVVGRQITGADVLRFAEVAMHEAKHRRAGVVLATDELVRAAGDALDLESDLHTALAGDGLALHYQPVLGPDGVVHSAEALVRWPHPQRGMLGPADSLPIAQRCGLLRELDLWVLRTATREAARWPAHDGRVAAVAVNLAGLLPADPGFLAAVTDAVSAGGLGFDRLVLELVESSLVELPPHALEAMAELVERGVRFAVDDFGTGWSGLARLRSLPAQVIKLDRAFVTGVAADPLDRAVARTVLDLARVMGCEVVAEGVETTAQYRVLRELGVELMQGWLFARALPAADLRALLVGDRLPLPD